MASMSAAVHSLVKRHLDSHQRQDQEQVADSQDGSLEKRLAVFESDYQKLWQGDQGNSNSAASELLSKALIHFINVLVSQKGVTTSNKDAVLAVADLLGALTTLTLVDNSTSTADTCRNLVLDHAIRCTRAALERVRIVGLRIIGALVSQQHSHSTKRNMSNALLDQASQALVPRFTDKALAVRAAAIGSAGAFFHQWTGGGDDDPDLRIALCWSLQHDTSVTNRKLALDALPVHHGQAVEVLTSRVRDCKPALRTATLHKLLLVTSSTTESLSFSLDAAQRASLAHAGLVQRCEATKQAASDLICLGWMKEFKYQPLELLKAMDVVSYDQAAAKVIGVLLDAAVAPAADQEDPLATLSVPEQRAFRQGVEQACTLLSTATTDNNTVATLLSPEQALWNKVAAEHAQRTKSPAQAERFVGNHIVPDMSVLCNVLQRHGQALVQAISGGLKEEAGDDDEAHDDEDIENAQDNLSFSCLQLLQLASIMATTTSNDGSYGSSSMEEGSRQLLQQVLQGLLSSVVTPDDLVEPCVQTLLQISDSHSNHNNKTALDAIDDVTTELGRLMKDNSETSMPQELIVLYQLRRLAIWTVTLEHAPLTAIRATRTEILQAWGRVVEPLLTIGSSEDDNSADIRLQLQQAAVSCWGRLGLYQQSLADFCPPLVALLLSPEAGNSDGEEDDDEGSLRTHDDLRAQCLLALVDWALLAPAVVLDSHPSIVDTLSEWLSMTNPDAVTVGQQCLAAELCGKLLLQQSATTQDDDTHVIKNRPQWVARLLILLFQPPLQEEDHSDDDEDMSLGQPGRLPQVLSVLFRTLSPHLVAEATTELLRLAVLTKRKKTAKLPLTKLLDFALQTIVENSGNHSSGTLTPSSNVTATTTTANLQSHMLTVAIQLADFVREHAEERAMTKTNLRTLCKCLGQLPLLDDTATNETDADSTDSGDDGNKEETTANGAAFTVHNGNKRSWRILNDAVEDMHQDLSDAAALQHLEPLKNDILAQVMDLIPDDEDDESSSSDDASDNNNSIPNQVTDDEENTAIADDIPLRTTAKLASSLLSPTGSRRSSRTSLGTVN